ncbi:MFS general substrate transporter, partial [Backusella circina FSU 941]
MESANNLMVEKLTDRDSSTTFVGEDVEKTSTYEPIKTEDPPNGGLQAWIVVFGGFCGNVGIWGVNYTWGVFLNYYNEYVFPGQMNSLSWIGSICVALFFILGPINEWVTCKLGFFKMLVIGTILCPLALMLSSISNEIWHLYLTQGVLFGVGASFIFFPCMQGPQEWFTTRRGLAVGLSMCGSGVGGLLFSNVCQAAIDSLGYRWSLRIAGFVCFAFLLVSAILVKPPHNTGYRVQESFSVLFQKQKALIQSRQFQIMLIINTITTFGYLTPAFYLASYATSIGLDPWIGANLGAIMSAVNAISMLSIGWISDATGRINCLFICTFLSGIFTLTIWTTAKSAAAVWVYAVLYGFFGGGYIALTGASLPEVAGYDNISAANGMLYFTSVAGYLFGSPITAAFINKTTPPNYTNAAVYCGVLMTVGGIFCWLLRTCRAGWSPLKK